MNISANLQYLRKRDRITQEELADKLGVSRQSVSKWETGEAYPETDKLINICELFGVSLDKLVREKIADGPPEPSPAPDAPEAEKASEVAPVDPVEFHSHMKNFAQRIALGVFFTIVGVGACIMLAGFAQLYSGNTAEFLNVMSAIAVLLPVAGAVFLFVFSGIRHSEFRTEHPAVRDVVTKAEQKEFDKKFSVALACLISGIIFSVVVLITLTSLVETGMIVTQNADAVVCFVTAAFFVAISAIVAGLVYFGIRHSEFHTAEYNESAAAERAKAHSPVGAIVMLTATAIFLTVGFVWNVWHPTWVVFPVGGIVCGIIDAALGAARKNRQEKDDGEQ